MAFFPGEFFRKYAPFLEHGTFNGFDSLFRSTYGFGDGHPGDSRIRLYRSTGGQSYDLNRLRYNWRTLEVKLNHLANLNFEDFGQLSPDMFLGMDGRPIVTQDQITVQPQADMTNQVYNRIPRVDYRGYLPMSNATHAQSTNGRLIGALGTAWMKVSKDRGQLVFAVNSTPSCWLDMNGWQNADPGATAAPDNGFAITFDEDKSLWYFWKDNEIIGVVDGNVQTSNFRVGPPGDDAVYETEEAYIDLDETNDRIEFWCKTSEDSAIKGCGYINSSGINNGEA